MKNKFQIPNLLIIALTIHIFSVHSKLLYYLNPELDEKPRFSFLDFTEPNVLSMVFAMSYSLATFFAASRSRIKWLIYLFAFLDCTGVLLYYFTKIPLYWGAIYFALYTGILIISTIYVGNPEYLTDQIVEMKEKGISQREIAHLLNVSESMVSRSIKRRNSSVLQE